MTAGAGDDPQRGLRVDTALGSFDIALDERAPRTCRYFEKLAARGDLDDGAVFRITGDENRTAAAVAPIDVVQFGLSGGLDAPREAVPHESTGQTGLTHRRWVVSAARYEAGKLYGSFFICLRDEPALDEGGQRQKDGKGYAAFGCVVAGHSTVHAIYERIEPEEMLSSPIPLRRVAVIDLSTGGAA